MQTEHLSFLILQNFPAAAPSGATAAALRGGCNRLHPHCCVVTAPATEGRGGMVDPFIAGLCSLLACPHIACWGGQGGKGVQGPQKVQLVPGTGVIGRLW